MNVELTQMKNTDTYTADPTLIIDPGALRAREILRQGEISEPGRSWPELAGEFAGPARVAYRVKVVADGVRVVGELSVKLRLACRRCLEPVDEVVRAGFDALYRTESGDRADEDVLELPSAGLLDLTGMLREELLLAVPDWPVCRPDCRGLCPRCGVDLNAEECDCSLEQRDPRWDALRALRGS